MSESSNDSSTDSLLALVSLAGFVGVGFASVAAFLQPVQLWLIANGVLTTGDGVILGWGVGETYAGLDLVRIVIAAAALVLLVVGPIVMIARRRARNHDV